jgi:hypothetical protein
MEPLSQEESDRLTDAWNVTCDLRMRFTGSDADMRYWAWASVIAKMPDDVLVTVPLGDQISCLMHGDVRHAICNGYYEAPAENMHPTPKRAERWLRNNTKHLSHNK